MQDKQKQDQGVLGIFAGLGILPQMLIEDCQRMGRKFFIFLLEGENYEIDYLPFSPVKLCYGEVEKFLSIVRANEIKDLVFIGAVTKPNFSSLKVDKRGALLLTKILASKILGDDAVLRAVIKFFEKEGLKIIPINQLLKDLAPKKSILSKLHPSKEEMLDIEIAVKAIRAMSYFDIGQAVVVAQKQIIAVEALEGTDNMISRCAGLKVEYKEGAILVKLKKAKQSAKADLPTIGVDTIKNCNAAAIKGIAIQAGATLIVNKEEVLRLVDELGMFLIAI
jgi:hypothetical protein